MSETPETPEENSSQGVDTLQLIYILYLASTVLQVSGLIGLLWGVFEKKNAPEWQQSHYEYLSDTFFKGVIYTFASLLLMFVFIGFLTLPLVYVWWVIRGIKGLKAINRREPIYNPNSWLF